jgi:transketolase
MTISQLQQKSKELRRAVLEMVAQAGSGHPGGALSSADLLTVLYYKYLRHRPEDPRWPERDRFVLSNGHVCPILYAIWPIAAISQRRAEEAAQARLDLAGASEFSVGDAGGGALWGSLGLGLSVSLGMALAAKLDKKDYKIYCLNQRWGVPGGPDVGSGPSRRAL